MKRILFFFLIGAASFASCEQEYTCGCTASDPSLNVEYTETLTRSDAEAWCDGWQAAGAATAGWSCTLSN